MTGQDVLDLAAWLGYMPGPLARVVQARLALFHQKYALHTDWPVLTLPAAICEAYRIPAERAAALKAGCVLFFLAADIIDDAQDGDLPEGTAWTEAINAGQAFLFAALGAFAEAAPQASVAREVHEAGGRLVAGQALDLALTWDSAPSEDTVMAAVRGKSGASLALFARMGAHAAARPLEDVAAWGAIGDALGTAIQLRSDLRDLDDPASRDFRARKATLPVAYALGRSGGAFARAANAGDRSGALAAIRACGGHTFVDFKIDALVYEAVETIGGLDLPDAATKQLTAIVHAATAAPLAL